jgi:hypothetical protein
MAKLKKQNKSKKDKKNYNKKWQQNCKQKINKLKY